MKEIVKEFNNNFHPMWWKHPDLVALPGQLIGAALLCVWALWEAGWFNDRPVITMADLERQPTINHPWNGVKERANMSREFVKTYKELVGKGFPFSKAVYVYNTDNPVETLKMAWTMWCEGREVANTSYDMIASVIVNRKTAGNSRWGDTVTSVISDPEAFSCWGDDGDTPIRKVTDDFEEFTQAIKVAVAYQKGKEPVTTATHYHTRKVNPVWNKHMEVVGTDGPHVYYVAHNEVKTR